MLTERESYLAGLGVHETEDGQTVYGVLLVGMKFGSGCLSAQSGSRRPLFLRLAELALPLPLLPQQPLPNLLVLLSVRHAELLACRRS